MSQFNLCSSFIRIWRHNYFLLPVKDAWREYFSFSGKERTGIIILVLLIIIATIIPFFYNDYVRAPVKANDQLLNYIRQSNDSALTTAGKNERFNAGDITAPAPMTFEFDPNTISIAGWKKLGVKERTIQTIQHYLAKGGKFRKPEDITRIYGLPATDAKRLLPYVRIPPELTISYSQNNGLFKSEHRKAAPAEIDINEADTTSFIELPGVGSKLAQRIVNFREKLGGFYSIEQIAETYALPDTVFQKIKNRLRCPAVAVRKLNINTASIEVLKLHPYVRWNVASAIVKYRQQHGAFGSPEELQLIEIVTPELLNKLRPYIITAEE